MKDWVGVNRSILTIARWPIHAFRGVSIVPVSLAIRDDSVLSSFYIIIKLLKMPVKILRSGPLEE